MREFFSSADALIALGAPVMTSDYDEWLHFDDVELLNAAFAALDHHPNHTPKEARRRGRYVLENGQRADFVIARGTTASNAADQQLTFQQRGTPASESRSTKNCLTISRRSTNSSSPNAGARGRAIWSTSSG